MIIYKITNKINGKVYIGQTVRTLKQRWKDHRSEAKDCKRGRAIHKAIRKYGVENFTVEQIDVATCQEELNEKERYWIEFYDSMNRNKGYNLTNGGDSFKMAESVKVKISEFAKTRIGEKNPRYGVPMGLENRLKISAVNKLRTGEKNSFYGKHHTEETKQKMRGKRPSISGAKNPNAKKVLCIETGVVYECGVIASKETGVSYSSLRKCCQGNRKTAGGYHWQYIDK